MAVSESDFKAGFKKDLITEYPHALVWTNSDMFRAGLPDASATWNGHFFAMEMKFVSKLPKRKESKCLKHEVSGAQLDFLNKIRLTGHYSCVLVGMSDVAALMLDLKSNYTLDELMIAPRIERVKGKWNCDHFFDRVRGYNFGHWKK